MELYKSWCIAAGKAFFSLLQALLSPPFCGACRTQLAERVPLCENCHTTIQPVAPLTMAITESYSISVLAYGAYTEPLRSFILAKNYRNKIAADQAGRLLVAYVQKLSLPIDYIIPVPLHWMRQAQRGYNQAEVMARVVARYYNVPLEYCVKRVRATRAQKECTGDEREQNVQSAFKRMVYDKRYQGKHLMLIDDVVTTGATIKAIVKELKKLRPASITVVALCRVV